MIEKFSGYKFADQLFTTIQDAQKGALRKILVLHDQDVTNAVADLVLENKDAVIDILTMRPSSKPTLRKINGAKRKARAVTAAQNAAIQDGKQ